MAHLFHLEFALRHQGKQKKNAVIAIAAIIVEIIRIFLCGVSHQRIHSQNDSIYIVGFFDFGGYFFQVGDFFKCEKRSIIHNSGIFQCGNGSDATGEEKEGKKS